METNTLYYEATRIVGKRRVTVKIRLSDECGNGHNDFSVTGSVFEKQRDGSWEQVGGGCCHDEILAFFPEFKPFVDLHLCDAKGAPMYPEANGFYFLEQKDKQDVVKRYLRLSEQEYEKIKATVSDKLCLKYLLYNMGIVARWEQEANAAIASLEALTGKRFKDDSRRYQLTPLTPEEITLIEARMLEGYYLPEAIECRRVQAAEDKRLRKIGDLKDYAAKQIRKIKAKLVVDLYIAEFGPPTDNFIYYDHINTVVFNWRENPCQDTITQEEFEAFLAQVDYAKLPEGIKFNLNKCTEDF